MGFTGGNTPDSHPCSLAYQEQITRSKLKPDSNTEDAIILEREAAWLRGEEQLSGEDAELLARLEARLKTLNRKGGG